MNVEGLKKMRVVKFARRKKKIISRIFACALGAALCVWLGATAYRIAQADRRRKRRAGRSRPSRRTENGITASRAFRAWPKTNGSFSARIIPPGK